MILIDTREQKYDHIISVFDGMGIPWKRTKLNQGDYMDEDNPSLTVDRKQSLQEVYCNLIGPEHARFRRELLRCREAGQKVVVLVETWQTEHIGRVSVKEPEITCLDDVKKWINPRAEEYKVRQRLIASGQLQAPSKWPLRPPVGSPVLAATMATMTRLYDCEWQFCPHQKTAEKILEILKISVDIGIKKW